MKIIQNVALNGAQINKNETRERFWGLSSAALGFRIARSASPDNISEGSLRHFVDLGAILGRAGSETGVPNLCFWVSCWK